MSPSNNKRAFALANFHCMTARECASPLFKFKSAGFFESLAAHLIEQLLIIAKAYKNTKPGKVCSILNDGKSVDSPEWVEYAINNPGVLLYAMDELSGCFDLDVFGAISDCRELLSKMTDAPETHKAILEAVNNQLEVFRSNKTDYFVEITPEILEEISKKLNCKFILPKETGSN